ncbi:MAG: translational GTPase TypA [bacterium]
MQNHKLRNIAIIAHVDHGKTTLVDQILKQALLFRKAEDFHDCFLDSNDLERERGITILSKNVSVLYKDTKINIIDTPGHSDFAGQVERVLKMADGALLLVDAADGPMPQTRFVLKKALELGLQCLVIINKVDKKDARPTVVYDMVWDLFVELEATNKQLDFTVLYASGRDGWASLTLDGARDSIVPLMDAILEHIPAASVMEGPVQMQVTTIQHSDYVGRTGIGRVFRGTLDLKTPMCHIKRDGTSKPVQLKQLFTFDGLGRNSCDSITCGDLCAVVGIPDIDIGDTLAALECPEALPPIHIDEPTISMLFRINDSPFFGREGKFVTSRHLRARLLLEAERDVAIRVEESSGDSFNVSGRGVLHLSILMENMRREGFEMTVAQPRVIMRDNNGVKEEPIETLTVDVPEIYAGKVIELVGMRRGTLVRIDQNGPRVLQEFTIPTRGTIGFRSKVLTSSAGEAIVSHCFSHYAPYAGDINQRNKGSMISMANGKAIAFACDGLQSRGFLFVDPGEECYEGMIVGEHCNDTDLVVNIQKSKELTNMRAGSSDRKMVIAPSVRMSLEQSVEYIADDELVEITPKSVRLRKRLLKEFERKRVRRQ